MRYLVLASSLMVGLAACTASPGSAPPAKLLGNPVVDARAALANGDSTYLGLIDPELELPGLDSATAEARRDGGYRAFSRLSLGLSESEWAEQRDSLRVYAAAYNQLILEATTKP